MCISFKIFIFYQRWGFEPVEAEALFYHRWNLFGWWIWSLHRLQGATSVWVCENNWSIIILRTKIVIKLCAVLRSWSDWIDQKYIEEDAYYRQQWRHCESPDGEIAHCWGFSLQFKNNKNSFSFRLSVYCIRYTYIVYDKQKKTRYSDGEWLRLIPVERCINGTVEDEVLFENEHFLFLNH